MRTPDDRQRRMPSPMRTRGKHRLKMAKASANRSLLKSQASKFGHIADIVFVAIRDVWRPVITVRDI